ncbi:peptidoglycan editing factor PgeF [Parasphingopyxis marina]|uniref:Purine nucleoside phosphorylase n=1 Tax=Parasphingopyxis marina TaxID=2761622 RepID=A0A842HYY2_9SPHN|nr:peptidoglycan editing factor PgeF [Parasphingopyxis marina]MBC2776704.1 peptidoglycan editing factor PgeF [Parasphingopyxis marina]
MAAKKNKKIDSVTADALDGVTHAFLGRAGGVSTGLYESLNVGLGTDDVRSDIDTNRRRALEAVAPKAKLVTLHQAHTPDAIIVTKAFPDDARPQADGMATDKPGLALGILTADCAPILLADREAGVIGAAHAGWKGAMTGIARSVVEKMEELGAQRKRIRAAIGPCIGRGSYEVDDDFRKRFEAIEGENEKFFRDGAPGHHHFDLEAYVASWLAYLEIGTVETLDLDTYTNEDRYFSYRRATHRDERDYGRQISLICL